MNDVPTAPPAEDTKPCKVCAEPIKAGALICTHCKSYQDWRSDPVQTKPCKVCAEPIKVGASACNQCKSYQNWRSGLNVSSSVLALLVALVSVLTPAIPVIKEALTTKNSDLVFSFQSARSLAISVLVSNRGTRAGSVYLAGLSLPNVDHPILLNPMGGSNVAVVVDPGATKMLALTAQKVGDLKLEVWPNINAQCSVVFFTTDFLGKEAKFEVPVKCGRIFPFLWSRYNPRHCSSMEA